MDDDLLALDARVTDCNSAFFDVAHNFAGCIPGLPRGAAPPGAARRHLVPRSEGKALAGPGARRSTASIASTPTSPTTPSCAPTSRSGCHETRNSDAGRWRCSAHLALLAAWYLFVRFGNVPKFVMPSPAATLDALLQPNYNWWGNIAVTGTEIFAGYFLALVVGVALALVFTWSKTLESFFMPLLVSLNMIPKVALGPLIIVWFKYGVFPELDHGVLDLRVPDPAHHGARPARDRARAARPRALAQGLALAAVHQDPAARRAAVHLLGHEGRRDPRRRGRDRRRVPRLGQGPRLPHAAGAGDARHAGDVHGGDPDHAARHAALRPGAGAGALARA